MKKILTLAVAFAICATALAQEEVGTFDLKVSNVVRVSVPFEASEYQWRVYGPKGKISGESLWLLEDGQVLQFEASSKGTYNILSIVEKSDGSTALGEYQYVVGETPDDPDPTPPGPKPVPPDVPDGEFGYIKFAYEKASAIPVSERNKKVMVTMPDGNEAEVTMLAAVAANWYNVSEEIKAGEVTDPQTAIYAVRDRNRELGANQGAWKDALTEIGKKGNEDHLSGKIKNIEDWGTVFNEVYQGLTKLENQ